MDSIDPKLIELAKIVSQKHKLDLIVLFGSRTTGRTHELSVTFVTLRNLSVSHW